MVHHRGEESGRSNKSGLLLIQQCSKQSSDLWSVRKSHHHKTNKRPKCSFQWLLTEKIQKLVQHKSDGAPFCTGLGSVCNFIALQTHRGLRSEQKSVCFLSSPRLPCAVEISYTTTMGTSKAPRGKLSKTKHWGGCTPRRISNCKKYSFISASTI